MDVASAFESQESPGYRRNAIVGFCKDDPLGTVRHEIFIDASPSTQQTGSVCANTPNVDSLAETGIRYERMHHPWDPPKSEKDRVLAAIEARGWTDDVDVIFTTDHGELFGVRMYLGPCSADLPPWTTRGGKPGEAQLEKASWASVMSRWVFAYTARSKMGRDHVATFTSASPAK